MTLIFKPAADFLFKLLKIAAVLDKPDLIDQ